MIPKDGINLQYLKTAFLRRFWYMVLPFFVVSMATVGYCIKTPRLYKAETLILVEPQKVSRESVGPTVPANLGDPLRTIVHQFESLTRLEEIINEYDLYPDIRAGKTAMDPVEVFRKEIEINAKGSGTGSFEISYTNRDPVKARDVTNAIANLFVEDNPKPPESQTTGTTAFLDGEVERMREVLRQKEEEVRQFKETYFELMPEQMKDNVRILKQLEQQVDSLDTTIQQTKERKALLQTQLRRLEAARADTGRSSGQHSELSGDQGRPTLEELRLQLKRLKSRYSDKHPDVIRLRGTIAKREKKQGTTPVLRSPTSEARRLMLVQKDDFLSQLKLIDKRLAALAKEKGKTHSEIAQYKHRIEEGPKIEQMFLDLRKDYEEASENYQSVLEKRLQAQLSENLEKSQPGEPVRIVEHAKLPEKPFRPNSRRILTVGFMTALACAFGLALFREYLDPTFWSSKELERIVDLPVLVSIPVVNTEKERHWNVAKRAAAAGALFSMVSVLFYALFVLWRMDPTAFHFLVE